ncbi:GNAT family N-acetyltransferase [Rhodomicrobium lacus]|jgi:GNAT superfamily N-acetyltransferase|uniref:GNAT family N-acetyltransferase n=1 Tax=Rhodomicrobium lacus TaxID=2498452 RepID=UPI0026E2AFA5|nr:GNAT family N-acetyltransferase [Rhodomicrobium lacus]WKW52443.1 GNAT family N-acetyltransferase [Rhodomicrobium lacus]
MRISTLTGPDLERALPELARLRIEVFRAYPYLYDGSLDYEQSYLASFAEATDSIAVVAENDHGRIVGCATGSALEGHNEEFGEPFRARGIDAARIFYCGESVLDPSFRGRGIGHAFFDAREAHARARGYRSSAFCAVVRPDNHPLKPADYSPLEPFWKKRGYRKAEGLIATFHWKDIDQADETAHPMQFWIREFD